MGDRVAADSTGKRRSRTWCATSNARTENISGNSKRFFVHFFRQRIYDVVLEHGQLLPVQYNSHVIFFFLNIYLKEVRP